MKTNLENKIFELCDKVELLNLKLLAMQANRSGRTYYLDIPEERKALEENKAISETLDKKLEEKLGQDGFNKYKSSTSYYYSENDIKSDLDEIVKIIQDNPELKSYTKLNPIKYLGEIDIAAESLHHSYSYDNTQVIADSRDLTYTRYDFSTFIKGVNETKAILEDKIKKREEFNKMDNNGKEQEIKEFIKVEVKKSPNAKSLEKKVINFIEERIPDKIINEEFKKEIHDVSKAVYKAQTLSEKLSNIESLGQIIKTIITHAIDKIFSKKENALEENKFSFAERELEKRNNPQEHNISV